MTKIRMFLERVLAIIASICEYAAIFMYFPAMGYEWNWSVYKAIYEWEYSVETFYFLATISICIYTYFVFQNRKNKEIKNMIAALISAVILLILVISKVKI